MAQHSSRRPADRRPTLSDVAALAGVSKMVASRAMNDSANVSRDASEKVKNAATMLGYIPHQGAKSLATNRTGAIAFLAPMNNHRFFGDPNVAELLLGVKQSLSESGMQLVTLIVEDRADQERVAKYVMSRHVDGVVILSPELVEPLVRDLARARVPMAANGIVSGAESLDSIVVDSRTSAREMARVLQEAGVTDCAVIAGGEGRAGTLQVLDGIRDVFGTIRNHRVVFTDHSFQSGQEAMEELLELDPGIDGVFISSDVMADAAIQVLKRHHRAVPDDVKVTGWDNSLPADAINPPLTTLDVPFLAMGRDLAAMLVEQIAGRPGGEIREVSTQVVRRESA
jgi:DNA-binding LacI/PurR family transcriptional regulator